MNFTKTLKKVMSVVISFAVVMVMLCSLPTVEVSAATVGNFTINAGDAGIDYTLDTSVHGEETLTVMTSNVGSVGFDTHSGNVGHVIINSGATIDGIDTNGDVTVNGTVSLNVNTNGNVTVNGTVSLGVNTNGNVTVNSGGVVSGTANTMAGTLNVAAGGSVGGVDLTGTTTIDGTNLTVQNAAGAFLVPLSAISSAGTITIDGDLTLSGNITQRIFSGSNTYIRRTITVLGDTTLSHASGGLHIHNLRGTDLNINSGTLTVSNGISLSSLWFNQNITINGNIAGDILINNPADKSVDLNYESGTLTGKIDFVNTGNTVEIGTAATVTGIVSAYAAVVVKGTVNSNVSAIHGTADISGTVNGNVAAGGSITVSGTINGNASAVAGSIKLTPTGVVTGLMSPTPYSNVIINGITGGAVNLAYNQYYPVNTADTVGAPQSAAPASGGYIRITTDGAKNILELNNIDVHLVSGTIEANGSTLPLEIYAVGENALRLLNHDLPITMTAASGGEFSSQIYTTDTFTMQSGTLRFNVSTITSRHGINASAIVINGGQMSGEGAVAGATNNAAAFSVKPTINPPAGMMARIMVAPSRTGTPTEVAESTAYHLNNYVQISFVVGTNTGTTTGTTTTTTTTTTYNPAISPQTGVYTH